MGALPSAKHQVQRGDVWGVPCPKGSGRVTLQFLSIFVSSALAAGPEKCSSGGCPGLVGLLRVVIAHECLRALKRAFGDDESQVGGAMNSAEMLLDTPLRTRLQHYSPEYR